MEQRPEITLAMDREAYHWAGRMVLEYVLNVDVEILFLEDPQLPDLGPLFLLCGQVAERLGTGGFDTELAERERAQARELASMGTSHPAGVDGCLHEAESRAEAILTEYWKVVQLIADDAIAIGVFSSTRAHLLIGETLDDGKGDQ